MTEAQLRERIETELLSAEIAGDAWNAGSGASSAEVERFYRENVKRFRVPERRDVRIVVTKSRPAAERAEEALRRGVPWPQVVERWSVDASTERGGLIENVARAQLHDSIAGRVFGAGVGELSPPAKWPLGWYAVEVVAVHPPQQQRLADVRDDIKEHLDAEPKQEALTESFEELRGRRRPKTLCDESLKSAQRANGPERTASTCRIRSEVDAALRKHRQAGGHASPFR